MSARHLVRCTTPVVSCSQNETNTKGEKAQGCTDLIPSCMALWKVQHAAGPTSH